MSGAGLGPQTLAFLAELRANNDRDWFQDNKARYEQAVKQPSADFAQALAEAMQARHNTAMRSRVFRLHRDLRFSKDKTPYNTFIHLACMDEASGAAWMVGLEPVGEARSAGGAGSDVTGRLDLGYGCLVFSKPKLAAWRKAVSGDGAAVLDGALAEVKEALGPGQSLRLNALDLKRVPSGFEADGPGAHWLRRKAFCVWIDGLRPDLAFADSGQAKTSKQLAVFDPLRAWWLAALS